MNFKVKKFVVYNVLLSWMKWRRYEIEKLSIYQQLAEWLHFMLFLLNIFILNQTFRNNWKILEHDSSLILLVLSMI